MAVLALHRHEQKEDRSYLYWFLVAVAYKVPWTAISSLLGQFSHEFKQPRILLYLNLAYFIPSVPALLIHSSIQERLERRYGLPKAALLRFIIGLGGLTLLSLLMPHFCSSPQLLLTATAAVGVLYSIAFGTSYQLVTHFSPACTVALTTGFVSCGVVVLLADLAIKRGPYYTQSGLNHLFTVVAAQTAIGLVAAATVLRQHWRRLSVGAARSSDVAAAAAAAAAGVGSGGVGRSVNGRAIIGLPQIGSSSSSGRLLLGPSAPGVGWNSHSSSSHTSSSSSSYVQAQQHEHMFGVSSYLAADGLRHRTDVENINQHRQQQLSDHQADDAAETAVAIHLDDTTEDKPLLEMSSPSKQHKRPHRTSRSGGLVTRCYNSVITTVITSFVTPLTQLLQLGSVIWPACLGLMISVGTSMMVFPFFTFVPHTGFFGEHIPQVLFYSRLLGDISGRLMPHKLHLSSSKAVLAAAATKSKLLMLLIPALLKPSIVGGDISLALIVALNWWLSGYINTGAYLLAPRLVSSSSKKGSGGNSGSKTKAGGLMAFCFQTACFLGLMGAWVLQSVFMANWTHHAYSDHELVDASSVDPYTIQQQQFAPDMLNGGLSAAAVAAHAAAVANHAAVKAD